MNLLQKNLSLWVSRLAFRLLYLEWLVMFRKAARSVDLKGPDLDDLSHKVGLVRFFERVFISGSKFPSTKDFAVSLAFEFHRLQTLPPDWPALGFAQALRDHFGNSFCFKFHNRFIVGKHRGSSPWVLTPDLSEKLVTEMKYLLKDVRSLRRRYFETFGDRSEEDTVIVYLGSVGSRLKVEVQFDLLKGMERGFYRIGYDYGLKKGNSEVLFLEEAFLDNSKREFGHFGNLAVSKHKAGPIKRLWVK